MNDTKKKMSIDEIPKPVLKIMQAIHQGDEANLCPASNNAYLKAIALGVLEIVKEQQLTWQQRKFLEAKMDE